MSDLIAKLKKWNSPRKQQLVLYNELFLGFLKIVLQISNNLLPKEIACGRTTVLPFMSTDYL
jgi:hypothetical protein